VCDFCGCPHIEPFATLIEDHATLETLAELFAEGRDGLDLEARGSVRDHVDGWEFEVFPQIVLEADADELEDTSRAVAVARGT
jgi:hypothetical protein